MFDGLFLKQLITQFHFMRPEWLVAFIPLALIVYSRFRAESSQQNQVSLPDHLKKALTVGDDGWKKQLPLKALSLIISLAIIVSAGPTWQRQPSPFGEDRAALMVVLDVSDSMLQTDVAPSRIERAKQKIVDLLQLRGGGQTGLVVYAGTAHLAMPLTRDNQVFMPVLSAVEPSVMPRQGKSAANALPIIDQQFGKVAHGGSVLLITDSANEQDISAYKELFGQNSYQLLVLAMGNDDRTSDIPMNLPSLQSLARAGNGSVIEVSIDTSDIEWLDRQVQRHMQLSGDLSMPWQDMGYYLVFVLAFILLLWFRRGWMVQWSLVVFLSVPFSSPADAQMVHLKAEQTTISAERSTADKLSKMWRDLWLTPDQQGQWYFNRGQYLKAAHSYNDPMSKGVAFFYAQEYKLAQTAFMQVDSFEARFNVANALVGQREYVAARNMLQSLADEYPDNEDVRTNLAIVSEYIEFINQYSDSQARSMEGASEQSTELGDKPQTADGAEERVTDDSKISESYSADQILQDQEIADKWLKRVEADPKNFLRAKFQIQLNEQSEASND